MTDEIRVGQVGFTFIITFKNAVTGAVINVSTASTKKITFRKASGTAMTKTASFTTDGSDGKIQWTTTLEAELSESGDWTMQGKVVMAGATYRTSMIIFRVAANLAEES